MSGAAEVRFAPADGPPILTRADANALIALAFETGADVVAVPLKRFDAAVFRLETGRLGEILQAFANYRLRLAVLGDVAPLRARSRAFDGLVIEADRGRGVIFAANAKGLQDRLADEAARGRGQAAPGAGSSR